MVVSLKFVWSFIVIFECLVVVFLMAWVLFRISELKDFCVSVFFIKGSKL